MRRLTAGRTLHVIYRPHGLPPGASTADMADEYAALLGTMTCPADVMGLSTGGLIAQHVALSHPELVRRLVLVVTGARLSDQGRQLCTRWASLADEGRWRELRGSLAAAAVDGRLPKWLARRAGSARSPAARDAADFRTMVAADLRHDTTTALRSLDHPTLVIGGATDPFFPEPALRATAKAIPNAVLRLHAGGHGVPKHHSRWLQREVLDFLSTTSPPTSKADDIPAD